MQIAILGAGNVGSALARGWSRAGHSILLGLRDPARYARLLADTGATALPLAKAAALADIVVLALPWAVAAEVAAGLGEHAPPDPRFGAVDLPHFYCNLTSSRKKTR